MILFCILWVRDLPAREMSLENTHGDSSLSVSVRRRRSLAELRTRTHLVHVCVSVRVLQMF